MARGNDAEQAAAELRRDFGEYEGLDELIVAHRAAQDPRVIAAGLWGYDVEATENLDPSTLPVEGEVLAYAVKQNRNQRVVIAVVEVEPEGRTQKMAFDYPVETAHAKSAEPKGKAVAKEAKGE